MKIGKAIEILELNLKEAGKKMPLDCRDSVQLGIEALEWLNQWRGMNSSLSNVRLPSETIEE